MPQVSHPSGTTVPLLWHHILCLLSPLLLTQGPTDTGQVAVGPVGCGVFTTGRTGKVLTTSDITVSEGDGLSTSL